MWCVDPFRQFFQLWKIQSPYQRYHLKSSANPRNWMWSHGGLRTITVPYCFLTSAIVASCSSNLAWLEDIVWHAACPMLTLLEKRYCSLLTTLWRDVDEPMMKNPCDIISSPSNICCQNFVCWSPNLHQLCRDFCLHIASTHLLTSQCF